MPGMAWHFRVVAVLYIFTFACVDETNGSEATIPDLKIESDKNSYNAFGVDSKLSKIDNIQNKLMTLVSPPESNLDGCKPYAGDIPKRSEKFIMLVDRGGCFFSDKLVFAQQAGASAILVANSMNSLFRNNDASLAGYLSPSQPCAVNCAGSNQACKSCPSSMCVNFTKGDPATAGNSSASYNQCCVHDRLLQMFFNASFKAARKRIPAIHMGLQDGLELRQLLRKHPGMKVKISVRPTTPPVIPGTLLLALAACVVIFGSVYAAQNERNRLRPKWANQDTYTSAPIDSAPPKPPPAEQTTESGLAFRDGDHPQADPGGDDEDESTNLVPRGDSSAESAPAPAQPQQQEPQQYITLWTVVFMVVFASAFLVGLYFLIRASQLWIYTVIDGCFFLAGWSSFALVVTIPATAHVLSKCDRVLCTSQITGRCPVSLVVGLILALAPTIFWVYVRDESYAWVPQDILGVCLCFNCLNLIKVPSLRVAVLLLSAMMMYDVFMTFITPLIMGRGNSIMMVVATGGRSAGSSSCTDSPAPQIPMLVRLPYMDYRDQYAMLGLGDMVFPGMLLAYAVRLDTVMRGGPFCRSCFPFPRLCGAARYDAADRDGLRTGCGYSPLLWCGYVLGLFLAQLANYMNWTIAGVEGQPALLYLVPCTCIPLVVFAAARRELCEIWGEHNPTRPDGSNIQCCSKPKQTAPSSSGPVDTDGRSQLLNDVAGE